MTKTFIFIRHGQSMSNAGKVDNTDKSHNQNILANHQIPLTPKGMHQSQQLADQWMYKPHHIYCSEFTRAHQTAMPFCQKFHMPATQIPSLNEFDAIGFDIAEKLNPEEHLTLIKRYWQTADPKERIGFTGETYEEFCHKVMQFRSSLPELIDQSIIIGHGMWFAQFIWQTLGLDEGKPLQNMHQFGKFFLNTSIPNLSQFYISSIDQRIAIQKLTNSNKFD
ncbi:phosphoglycerate mutase family protein [Ignatzschineria rhizosphaerae]|uniref:Phosphoglycerate mutase family protein n=1 Tax=Ignatzschineria rhizosphaerae TaxID=2923279 RepID=A0ABY3X513_9GAMM|nr:histidine phosphatase family protein [Ignatzschineria rhizosphaerae]UNM97370.1 phosphoglycerate mutase family protein [Ignatzschineria rhizosphaerae]